MLSLPVIQAEVERLASIIGAPGNLLPTYGRTEDSARPHVEADERGLHYVVVERGQELSRVTTQNLDELLYHIFDSVTFSMSQQFLASHRVKGQDSRRIHFRRQIELFAMLAPTWAERQAREHDQILRQHPFDDFSELRATLTKQLQDHGHSSDEAWQLACERYPEPAGRLAEGAQQKSPRATTRGL